MIKVEGELRISQKIARPTFFYRFSLTRQIFQFFADFTILAIFAVFAKKENAALVGALSTSSSTGFHLLDEFSNFSQILHYLHLHANLEIQKYPNASSENIDFSQHFRRAICDSEVQWKLASMVVFMAFQFRL